MLFLLIHVTGISLITTTLYHHDTNLNINRINITGLFISIINLFISLVVFIFFYCFVNTLILITLIQLIANIEILFFVIT